MYFTYRMYGNIDGAFYLAVLGSNHQIKIHQLVLKCTCAF